MMKSSFRMGFRQCAAMLLLAVPLTIGAQSTKKVTGTVTDENGEPLIGVTVMAVGSQAGGVTDIDGNYSVTVPASTKQLQFSYVGYSKQLADIGEQALNVRLVSDNELKEVVVIGYGVQKKTT